MELQPHQTRVVDEKTELAAKLYRLNEFLKSDKFAALDRSEQDRMREQSRVMASYCQILNARIAAF